MSQIILKDIWNKQDKESVAKKVGTKRQRSENWSEEDKMLLKDLVKERVKEIENKNTDTNTNKMKKKAWLDLESVFNSLCTTEKRTVPQLKAQWTIIKMQARKEVCTQRKAIKETGGGPAPQLVPLSGSDISAWLPNEFVVDENEFDSDFLEIQKQVCSEDLPSTSRNTVSEELFPDDGKSPEYMKTKEPDIVAAVEKNVPKENETPIVRPNKRKRERYVRHSGSDVSISDAAKVEIECRKELHLLQIEAEKKRLRNLDLEYEVLQEKLNFYKRKTFDKN